MKRSMKISVTLVGVLLMAVLSSATALISARHIGHLMRDMVEENLASVRAAEELEIALLKQGGVSRPTWWTAATAPAWTWCARTGCACPGSARTRIRSNRCSST